MSKITVHEKLLLAAAELDKAGGKGLFVSEVEACVSRGEADFAVHSLKDVPGDVELAEGMALVCLPLLDGSDQVGVMVLTIDSLDDDDRRLLRRLSGLVADMLVTKHSYTDQFFQIRRRAPSGNIAISATTARPNSLSPPCVRAVS